MEYFAIAILGAALIFSQWIHHKHSQTLIDKVMAGSYKDYKAEQRADVAQQHMIEDQKQAGVIYKIEDDKDYL